MLRSRILMAGRNFFDGAGASDRWSLVQLQPPTTDLSSPSVGSCNFHFLSLFVID